MRSDDWLIILQRIAFWLIIFDMFAFFCIKVYLLFTTA